MIHGQHGLDQVTFLLEGDHVEGDADWGRILGEHPQNFLPRAETQTATLLTPSGRKQELAHPHFFVRPGNEVTGWGGGAGLTS